MFEKAIIWLRRHIWLDDSEEIAEVAVQQVAWCRNTRKDVDIADYTCNWTHEEIISVAAYNRRYGRFMVDDGVLYKTY